jgi:hypothetical protein
MVYDMENDGWCQDEMAFVGFTAVLSSSLTVTSFGGVSKRQ